MKYIEAQNLLNLGTISYTLKRVRGAWRPVTSDGKIMRRYTYVDPISKADLKLDLARIFGAEVFGNQVFVSTRTALHRRDMWASNDPLQALFQAAPVA
jgi:hypothetical protein